MQELIWQLFGLWPDLISPAMDQQEMGLVPEGYLSISGEADCGDRIVEPVRDSLTCREGIIRLEAEVYNTDGSKDAPPDDTLAYFFAYLPENSLCPYRLLSVRKATETEPWPARGQTDAQEGDPPVSGEQLAYLAVPDFLNAEQRELYQRAAAVYPIFVGSADAVDNFPRADGSLYGKYALVREFNGKNYIRAWNRYEHWEDFTAMLGSVFTPGYRDELLAGERFLNQDGILYYLDNGVGSILGYMPDVLPDEFAVTEQTETTLTFDRIGHYLTEWDEEQQRWNPDAYETRRFSIRMEKVEGSWRIARFADPNWDQETASVRTFDPVYFAREFSRGTSQEVLQEQFPDLREEPDPPQPGDPENLVLISEGWEYEGVPGVVLFTCDAGQLRTAYFHGYGADFEKFRAVRDTLERQLEQAGLMEQLEFGTMKATEAIDMNDHAKWVPFSEEETTFPPNYVLPVVLNFSQPSLSLSLEYAGAEAAPLWYKSLYNSTGPLAAREQAGPATDFCIGFAY